MSTSGLKVQPPVSPETPRRRPRRRLFGRIVAVVFLALFALLVLLVWQGVSTLGAMQVAVQHASAGIAHQSQTLHTMSTRLAAIQQSMSTHLAAIQQELQVIGQDILHLLRLV